MFQEFDVLNSNLSKMRGGGLPLPVSFFSFLGF